MWNERPGACVPGRSMVLGNRVLGNRVWGTGCWRTGLVAVGVPAGPNAGQLLQLLLSPSGAGAPSVRKLCPQPHSLVALGLWTWKPPPIMFST